MIISAYAQENAEIFDTINTANILNTLPFYEECIEEMVQNCKNATEKGHAKVLPNIQKDIKLFYKYVNILKQTEKCP